MNRSASFSSSVLDRIVETKRLEVSALRPRAAEVRAGSAAAVAAGGVADFEAALRAGPYVSVIAEVKRRSPSAGEIHGAAGAAEVARVYASSGVAAISVLTDAQYFGGSLADLREVGAAVGVPLLRKDFTIDELQIHEARAAGASAVLLIVRILDDAQLRDFGALARELGLAALVEVHDEREVERALHTGARIIGVNNRDLATFETDLGMTVRLAPRVPRECVLVGESGIRTAGDVARLAAAGASAVLVGETLMRASDPAQRARELAAVPRAPRTD